jgi:hypothetical protein
VVYSLVNELKVQVAQLEKLAQEKQQETEKKNKFSLTGEIKFVLLDNFNKFEASLKRGEISYKEFVTYTDLTRKALFESMLKLSKFLLFID